MVAMPAAAEGGEEARDRRLSDRDQHGQHGRGSPRQGDRHREPTGRDQEVGDPRCDRQSCQARHQADARIQLR